VNASRTEPDFPLARTARRRPWRTRTRVVEGFTAAALLLAALALAGCRTTPTPGAVTLLDPVARVRPGPPSQLDLAVVGLTTAGLASNRAEMEHWLREIEALHTREDQKQLREQDQPEMKGLVPLCMDLVNSTLDDPAEYREASKDLLHRWDLDPALKARLKQSVSDDLLRLAFRRNLDTWESLWARTFNAVSEPLGRSLLTGGVTAPLMLASSAAHYLAALYERPAISLQDRQALTLRKRFIDRHPDAPETPEATAKVLRDEKKLIEMHVDRHLRRARHSLDQGRPGLAALESKRASFFRPNDEESLDLLAEAEDRIRAIRELRQHSLDAGAETPADLALWAFEEFAAGGVSSPGANDASSELAQQLAELLLSSSPDAFRLDQAARDLRAADPSGRLADEAEYVMAQTQLESASWRRLEELAARKPADSNMARHARALIGDPWQDPYRSFLRAKASARRKRISYQLLGPFSEGPRYFNLPRSVAYLIDAPAIAQTLVTAPLRLFFSSGRPPRDFQRPAAVAGYRYLGRYPEGEHAGDVMRWLFDYEKDRERWAAALRLAEFQPDIGAEERAELMEQAGRQALTAADRTPRPDVRGSILVGVVREFPDSEAGREAGLHVRAQAQNATPQRIRVTRGYLEENPRVAGPSGLGLNRELLDGDIRNGELHEDGVAFLDGRLLEFALVDRGGEDEPPMTLRTQASSERVARAVAMLDETARVNTQLDVDEKFDADPSRDLFFERARLGLAEEPDNRASAHSTYVYRSMRERYGMVRARDSILPFDIVFQASIYDFNLGAFPRWRQPRQTPDAFLYK